MNSDSELLRRYAEDGDEAAFAEVVHRHVDLVYSAALRMTGGDTHLSQDAAQSVFTLLAQRSRNLSRHPSIVGWLYTTTRLSVRNFTRGERRRIAREQQAFAMQDTTTSPEYNWESLRPVLDEAVCRLNAADREAVLLRFFQNKSHREVGDALGLQEDAARKRVDRALEKLRAHFARRGVTVTSALLAGTISANSVQAAPVGLASALSGAALAGAGGTGLMAALLKTISMSTKTKTILAAAIILAAVTSTFFQQWRISRLQAELAAAPATRSPSAGKTGNAKALATTPASTADQIARLTKILIAPDTDQVARSRQMLDFIESLAPGDIRAVLDNFGKIPSSTQADWAKATLISRWAELDSLSALAWARVQPTGANRAGDLVSVFDAWAAKDTAAALAAINQVNDTSARQQIMLNTLGRMAARDPAAALAFVQRMPAGQQAAYGIIFYAWGMSNPTAGASALANLPPSVSRNQAANMLACSWAQQDPQTALAWADSLPAGPLRTSVLNSILGPMDPQLAAANIDRLPGGPTRNGQIVGISTNWAIQDPAAALTWVDNVTTGQTHDQAVQGILAQVAQTDPTAAVGYLAQQTDPAVRDVAIPQLAGTWANNDPDAALAWVQSLSATEGVARSEALKNVLRTWTVSDPASEAAYIQQHLSNDPDFSTMAYQAANNWALGDPDAAMTWVGTLPPGPVQQRAAGAVVGALASYNPQAAWDMVSAQGSTNPGLDQTLSAVLKVWSSQDAAQAATMVNNVPAGNARDEAIAAIADNWVKQDPLQASQWISTLPAGNARDNAVANLITNEGKNYPATAFNWALTIGNADTQNKQLNNVVQLWAKKDPVAAANAVQSANLTNQQRAIYLALIQQSVLAK